MVYETRHSLQEMSMSHPRQDPRLGAAAVSKDAAFGDHRRLLSHAAITLVLLMALAAMVAWLLLG
jgi:hypothetical protein